MPVVRLMECPTRWHADELFGAIPRIPELAINPSRGNVEYLVLLRAQVADFHLRQCPAIIIAHTAK